MVRNKQTKKKEKKRRRRSRSSSSRRTSPGRIKSIEEEAAEEEMEKSKDKTGGISCRINIRQKIEERSGRRNNQKRKE